MIKSKLQEFIDDFDARIIALEQSESENAKHIAHGYRIVINELDDLVEEYYSQYGTSTLNK